MFRCYESVSGGEWELKVDAEITHIFLGRVRFECPKRFGFNVPKIQSTGPGDDRPSGEYRIEWKQADTGLWYIRSLQEDWLIRGDVTKRMRQVLKYADFEPNATVDPGVFTAEFLRRPMGGQETGNALIQNDAGGSVTTEQIFKVWRERQERMKTARFRWTEALSITKNCLPIRTKGGELAPLANANIVQECSLVLDRGWVRHDARGKRWSGRADGFVDEIYSNSFFKNLDKTLHDPVSKVSLKAEGSVNSRERFVISDTYNLRPFLLFCRPLDGHLGGPLGGGSWAGFKLGGTGVVQGNTCYILSATRGLFGRLASPRS